MANIESKIAGVGARMSSSVDTLREHSISLETDPRKAIAKGLAITLAGMAVSNLLSPADSRTRNGAPILPSASTIRSAAKDLPMTIIDKTDRAKTGFDNILSGKSQLSLQPTFLRSDSNGNHLKLDWRSIVEPAQVHVSGSSDVQRSTSFEIPSKYAETFSDGSPVRKDDYKGASRFIDRSLQVLFAEQIRGFPASVYLDRNVRPPSAPEPISLTKASVVGSASFEGHSRHGAAAADRNIVDAENIELAGLRANAGKELLMEGLQRIGVKHASVSIPTTGKEIQPTSTEWSRLKQLSTGYGAKSEKGNIVRLISDYNHNRIKKSGYKKSLDQILGQKRSVRSRSILHGKNRDRFIIPIPLGMLLLGGLAIRRRRKQQSVSKPISRRGRPVVPMLRPVRLPVLRPRVATLRPAQARLMRPTNFSKPNITVPRMGMDWGQLALFWKNFKIPYFKIRLHVERGEWDVKIPGIDRTKSHAPKLYKKSSGRI